MKVTSALVLVSVGLFWSEAGALVRALDSRSPLPIPAEGSSKENALRHVDSPLLVETRFRLPGRREVVPKVLAAPQNPSNSSSSSKSSSLTHSQSPSQSNVAKALQTQSPQTPQQPSPPTPPPTTLPSPSVIAGIVSAVVISVTLIPLAIFVWYNWRQKRKYYVEGYAFDGNTNAAAGAGAAAAGGTVGGDGFGRDDVALRPSTGGGGSIYTNDQFSFSASKINKDRDFEMVTGTGTNYPPPLPAPYDKGKDTERRSPSPQINPPHSPDLDRSNSFSSQPSRYQSQYLNQYPSHLSVEGPGLSYAGSGGGSYNPSPSPDQDGTHEEVDLTTQPILSPNRAPTYQSFGGRPSTSKESDEYTRDGRSSPPPHSITSFSTNASKKTGRSIGLPSLSSLPSLPARMLPKIPTSSSNHGDDASGTGGPKRTKSSSSQRSNKSSKNPNLVPDNRKINQEFLSLVNAMSPIGANNEGGGIPVRDEWEEGPSRGAEHYYRGGQENEERRGAGREDFDPYDQYSPTYQTGGGGQGTWR